MVGRVASEHMCVSRYVAMLRKHLIIDLYLDMGTRPYIRLAFERWIQLIHYSTRFSDCASNSNTLHLSLSPKHTSLSLVLLHARPNNRPVTLWFRAIPPYHTAAKLNGWLLLFETINVRHNRTVFHSLVVFIDVLRQQQTTILLANDTHWMACGLFCTFRRHFKFIIQIKLWHFIGMANDWCGLGFNCMLICHSLSMAMNFSLKQTIEKFTFNQWLSRSIYVVNKNSIYSFKIDSQTIINCDYTADKEWNVRRYNISQPIHIRKYMKKKIVCREYHRSSLWLAYRIRWTWHLITAITILIIHFVCWLNHPHSQRIPRLISLDARIRHTQSPHRYFEFRYYHHDWRNGECRYANNFNGFLILVIRQSDESIAINDFPQKFTK